jgi:deoxyribonuclease V
MALTVPYIPGYLSFREGPAVLEALGRLRHGWDLLMCDGQGYAHPRRCGLACHVAITLDRPGIGVAKSRLIGEFAAPAAQAGQSAPLLDQGQQIGLVLRTRCGVRPLFISVAHRINLGWAARVVLACCAGCRVPEPTRQADIEVAKLKRGSGQ